MGSINSGIDVGAMFKSGQAAITNDGAKLQSKMDAIANGESLDQSQLLELQFAMGQYNAKLETLSSITKSIQDMLKSLAQRSG